MNLVAVAKGTRIDTMAGCRSTFPYDNSLPIRRRGRAYLSRLYLRVIRIPVAPLRRRFR